MATVLNARRMAKRKLQRSARKNRDKEERAKKVILCLSKNAVSVFKHADVLSSSLC